MALAGGTPTRLVHQRFDELVDAYRAHSAGGSSLTVCRQYEQQLGLLRDELRCRKSTCRLGELLRRMGAIDELRLGDALAIQQKDGRQRLLGEILVDLGWSSEETIRRAVEIQAASATTTFDVRDEIPIT